MTAYADPDADALDAPPPGLVPTSVHLSAILAQHDAAIGKPTGPDTVIEDWRFTDTGMHGTEHLERDGMNYHSRITRGPFVEEFGQDNGHRWHRDYDGFVSPTTTLDDESFFAERVEEDAADPKNDVSVAGETQGSKPAYVVRVKISGGQHPEWVFYDVATGFITRVERVVGNKHRIAATFDDFRTTGGVTTAWHVRDSWDPPELDDDYVRTFLQRGIPVDSAQFAQPPSTPRLASYQQGFQIPIQMYTDGTIIVRMTVAGRGLDMMLDTASPDTIIDERVAREMGLPTFGHVDRLADGGDVPFETMIPFASMGNMTMVDMAVLAEPFVIQWGWDTKIVGVLGYDFLANNVFKIDYVNGTLDLIAPSSFASADPVPGGLIVPMELDNGVPFVQMTIGSDVADNVAVANEVPHTTVFGNYIAGHKDDFLDLESGKRHEDEVPFADNGQYGRTIDVWIARVSHVHFGLWDYQQVPIIATNFSLTRSPDRTIDAFLGVDYLGFFDLYFDYPHNRFIVKPNKFFYRTFHVVNE